MAFRLPDLPKKKAPPSNQQETPDPFPAVFMESPSYSRSSHNDRLPAGSPAFLPRNRITLAGGGVELLQGIRVQHKAEWHNRFLWILIYMHIIYIYISFAKKWNLYIYIVNLHSILECMYGKTLETSIQRLCIWLLFALRIVGLHAGSFLSKGPPAWKSRLSVHSVIQSGWQESNLLNLHHLGINLIWYRMHRFLETWDDPFSEKIRFIFR